MTIDLVGPVGTIQKFGSLANGALVETLMVGPVQVPSGDVHHICDYKVAVKKGAAGTIFRLYKSTDGTNYTFIDAVEIGDYGTYTSTYGVSVKIKAGEYWKVTGQQDTAGRMAIRVGGAAKNADVRD